MDAGFLRESAEKALHEALAGVTVEVERALAKRDYAAALARLATLRPTVDGFFDAVMVNAEGPRPASQSTRVAGPVCAASSPALRPVLPARLSGIYYMQLLRSILFTLFMAVWSIGFGFLYCVVCPFLPFEGRFWMAGWLTYPVFFALRVICGLNYTVEGRENLPPGNHVIFMKHSSTWETTAS